MVFWRNRSAEESRYARSPSRRKQDNRHRPSMAPKTASAESQTNVVTLVTSRLADRLADMFPTADGGESRIKIVQVRRLAIKPAEQQHVFGQKRADFEKIRAALASSRGEHLLVLGEPGTGRLELAIGLAAEASRQPASDWIYLIEQHAPSRARAFSLPAGEKARISWREVSEALDKAWRRIQPPLKGDEHRISLDLLEEEMRYRGEKAVEHDAPPRGSAKYCRRQIPRRLRAGADARRPRRPVGCLSCAS